VEKTLKNEGWVHSCEKFNLIFHLFKLYPFDPLIIFFLIKFWYKSLFLLFFSYCFERGERDFWISMLRGKIIIHTIFGHKNSCSWCPWVPCNKMILMVVI